MRQRISPRTDRARILQKKRPTKSGKMPRVPPIRQNDPQQKPQSAQTRMRQMQKRNTFSLQRKRSIHSLLPAMLLGYPEIIPKKQKFDLQSISLLLIFTSNKAF